MIYYIYTARLYVYICFVEDLLEFIVSSLLRFVLIYCYVDDARDDLEVRFFMYVYTLCTSFFLSICISKYDCLNNTRAKQRHTT